QCTIIPTPFLSYLNILVTGTITAPSIIIPMSGVSIAEMSTATGLNT
ncbi:unnamed protein product, partial [marine sediment metagenome]